MQIPKFIDLFRKDLQLKSYAVSSIENYVSQINCFLLRFDNEFTEPAKINETAIKDWLLESNSINGRRHRLSALKLFYRLTIKQPMKLKYIEYPRSEKKLPIVLSSDEIQNMFNVCQNLKHKVILALLYGTGMRVGELINLQWPHIDRSRMIVNYPPTPEAMGWASRVTDSPNGNASPCFCFVSDCIPQPDNMFIPCFSIFFAAFTSLL